jgi:predicted amidohydrolase
MIRLGVAQSPAALGGQDDRVAWLEHLLDCGACDELDAVLLPELFQCGYSLDGVLATTPADQEIWTDRVSKLAKHHSVAIAYGYVDHQSDSRYNAMNFVDPDGTIQTYRKALIPPGFEQDVFQSGQASVLFDWRGLRIGLLICYDVEFPERVRNLALQGAELILVPTALVQQWDVVAQRLVPTRAFENGVYVAYANHCGAVGAAMFLGQSCIVSPIGQDVARAGADECVIRAVIDPAKVAAAQSRLPYLDVIRAL